MFERVLVVLLLAVSLQGCGGSDENGSEFNSSSSSAFIPDNDGDSVNDLNDQCLNTAEGAAVDENGCSEEQLFALGDDDSDGVLNNVDQCQGTTEGATVNTEGCAEEQLDSDSDGVNNTVDSCPNTPEGETVDASGCAASQADADGDSIADNLDSCPSTPAGEGTDMVGCSSSQKDSDGDGVMNSVDACKVTEQGAAVDAQGCSDAQNDTDSDGVANTTDRCPNTAPSLAVNAEGCTEAQLVNVDAGVLRTSGRDLLNAEGEKLKLRGINLQYGDNPGARLPSISPIAEVEANIVRIQLRDNTTADQLRDALDAVIAEGMIAMPMLWEEEDEITCTEEDTFLLDAVANTWFDEWLAVISEPQYQPHLMINIANEWGPRSVRTEVTTEYDHYIDTYETFIAQFRDAGILVPLVIDAPDCGQDWFAFSDGRGQQLIDADPERNVVLSLHPYNLHWDTQEEIDQAISQLNSAGYPYILGEFGDTDFTGEDHFYLMSESESYDIGWIAWSWIGNGGNATILDMSTSAGEVELTRRGEDIVNGPFGLAQTSTTLDFAPIFTSTGIRATTTGDVTTDGIGAVLREAVEPLPALAWTLDIPAAGDYEVVIDYVSDNAERAQNIVVNGGEPVTTVFPMGESPVTYTQAFNAGENTFEIIANWGFMTVNRVSIRQIDN